MASVSLPPQSVPIYTIIYRVSKPVQTGAFQNQGQITGDGQYYEQMAEQTNR